MPISKNKILSAMLAALLCIGLLAACGGETATPQASGFTRGGETADSTSEATLSVVATIFPQYDFVRSIAGGRVSLSMLLPPGSESHSFEPTPQDIITIQNCDLFIYTGGESDAWVESILDSMDTDGMRIISLIGLVDAVEEEIVEGMQHEHTHEEEDGHGGDDDRHDEDDHAHKEADLDEHVWTSPKNAMVIVEALCEALTELDPNGADAYTVGTAAYMEELQALDAALTKTVANAARTTLIFGDRFPFRYLAEHYGLSYYAAFPGCSTETEPSAATVAFLIDKVKEEDIPVIFHIEFSNEKMADTISGETGAQKLLLHSCHNVSPADRESGTGYLALMWQNVENLKEALN